MSVALSLKLFVVGKFKDRYLEQKCAEYSKKIEHDAHYMVTEIKDSDKEDEGSKLLMKLRKESGFTFALTEFGKEYESHKFAHRLEVINRPIHFVIGGHHGLSDTVLSYADEHLSLSKLTFTHEFARLILVEQLYRALSIINNRGYHREG
jgi:23S rRNA (pseudouridine1915-N3)-methyltransferase